MLELILGVAQLIVNVPPLSIHKKRPILFSKFADGRRDNLSSLPRLTISGTRPSTSPGLQAIIRSRPAINRSLRFDGLMNPALKHSPLNVGRM